MEVYLHGLRAKIFKVLPIFEQEPDTLWEYLDSLLVEMQGAKCQYPLLASQGYYEDILNTLHFFHSAEDIAHAQLRREILKSLTLVGKLNAG